MPHPQQPLAPFSIHNFALWVTDKEGRPVHHLSKLSDSPRSADSIVTDMDCWHRQFPELKFHNTDAWRHRQLLVCDASIKIMSEMIPNSHLHVELDLETVGNLSAFSTMRCETRFYDRGIVAQQQDKFGRKTTETRVNFNVENSKGRALIPFGSKFWVTRMHSQTTRLKKAANDRDAKSKVELRNREELQSLTAAQARTDSDAGAMTWRVINFRIGEEQRWNETENMTMEDLLESNGDVPAPVYPDISFDFTDPSFEQPPPPLDLEVLTGTALEGMSDFSNPNSTTVPSLATDYSQNHSVPSIVCSQDCFPHQHEYHNPNGVDFGHGHINLCLEPAINLDAYETNCRFAPPMAPLDPLASLEQAPGNVFADMDVSEVLTNCCPTKPTWPYHDLVSRFEGMAEHTQSFLNQATAAEDIAGHGVLHDGQLSHGMWKLQTGLGDDAVVGADARAKDEPLSEMSGHAILELIEQDQRDRDDNFSGF
jgi:transcriptional enhancer factor